MKTGHEQVLRTIVHNLTYKGRRFKRTPYKRHRVSRTIPHIELFRLPPRVRYKRFRLLMVTDRETPRPFATSFPTERVGPIKRRNKEFNGHVEQGAEERASWSTASISFLLFISPRFGQYN